MKFLIQFILISTILFKKLLCQLKSCEVIQMEIGETLIKQKFKPIIIQTDEEDQKKLNYSEYSIIRELVRIENSEVKQIISTQILPPFSIDSVFENLFCQFRKSKYYFISCIMKVNFNINEGLNIQDQQNIQIRLNIQDDEVCNDFFYNKNQQFIIFCISSFQINIYSVNIEQQTTLLQNYQIEQNKYVRCQRKCFQLYDNHYAIIFFQCQNWGIFIYYNNTIYLALNEEIVFSKFSQQIKYIENIQICQHLIYLIVETGYYQFSINLENQIQFHLYIDQYSNLIQIILSQNCHLIYQVQYLSSDNKTIIQNNNYYQQFNGTLLNANILKNILYIQINNQIYMIYNKELQQVINLNTSIINIDRQFNIIYQLDLISDELILYVLSYLRNFIQPTKKYIYFIHSQSFPYQINNKCYQINYTLQQSNESIQTLEFIDICQKNASFYYNKKGINLLNEYKIEPPSSSDFKISIFDNQPLFQICSKIKHFLKKDQTLLYYETNNQIKFLLIRTDNYVYKYNCDGLKQFIINIQSSKVFSDRNSILIWQDHKRILKLTKFQANEVNTLEIKFESEIINIFQCKNIVVVFTKNHEELKFIDFNTQSVMMVNLEIKRVLNILFDIYYQKKQQFQPFYFSKFPLQLLQYLNQVIIVIKSQIHLFQIDQIQIVLVKGLISDNYYILGVHLINNQIIAHIFDQEQISILNIFPLNNYEIIRPIEYQINDLYFCIAARNATKTFVLLFAIQNLLPLKLIHTIQIGRIQFYFQEQYLIYYDQEDVLMIFNMAHFQIQIDNFVQFKSDQKVYNFHVVPINSNESAISLEFSFRHYNNCYQLFKKTNNASLHYSINNKIKIQPNNYFDGPIDSLKILEEDNYKIDGPLLLTEVDLLDKEAKIKYIYLNSIFPSINNFKILYLQFQNNSIIMLNKIEDYILENRKKILLNIISINDQSILFLYIKDHSEYCRGAIHLIDEITFQLNQEPIFEIDIKLQRIYQSIKTGNLIIIKCESTLLIYQIVGFRIKFIQNELGIIEILKINGNNSLYISLSLRDYEILLFQILLFKEFQIEIIGTATLNWDSIRIELIKYFKFLQIDFPKSFHKSYFLECTIENGKVKIIMFQMIWEFSVISEIIILMENYEISYKLLKITRNNVKQDSMNLKYYSKNNLIFQSISDVTYFYDLTNDQTQIDYIGTNQQLQNVYHLFNTTHFIIYSNKEDKFFIAEIGYEININAEYQGNKTFTLVAENKLSQIELKVVLLEIDNDQINDKE